jgi:hypothetical protein
VLGVGSLAQSEREGFAVVDAGEDKLARFLVVYEARTRS